jgi:8-oxo-dGTP pyrophosphatase MutT (NUDIX family)
MVLHEPARQAGAGRGVRTVRRKKERYGWALAHATMFAIRQKVESMVDRLLGSLAEADPASCRHVRVAFVQKGFIVDRGRLLLVRKSATDPYHPGMWEVPGGRMQPAEGLDEHIVREVLEESGIEIQPGPPFHIWDGEMLDDDRSRVRAIAVGRICRPLSLHLSTASQVSGDHISTARWVPLDEIAEYALIPGMDLAVHHFIALHKGHLTEPLLDGRP